MSAIYDLRQANAADAAGKDTKQMNSSFSAFDYVPSRLEKARNFLMDDYIQSGRAARRQQTMQDSCWDILQYQKDVQPFVPRQGFSETKFHSGFMRRQGSQMPYLVEREERRKIEPELKPPKPRPNYDILTSEGMTPSMEIKENERRHVNDHRERDAGMHADAPGGRLRDSTSRFFCVPEQLPHRSHRQRLLETDGLTVTKRTSTVIGVGANPSQEIFSIGAREVLSDSMYGITRRRAGQAAREAAEDAAQVRALP